MAALNMRTFSGERDIKSLPKKFAAVATELATGHEIWLEEGSLIPALRASYAMPGIFVPVAIEGRGHGFLDVRLGEHGLEPVARRELHRLQRVRDVARLDRRHRWKLRRLRRLRRGVGVLIPFAVPEGLHEPGGGVAEVQWNRRRRVR